MTANTPETHSLSKSTFLAGKQCHLRLWYDFNARGLAAPPDDIALNAFEVGHAVGELACRRHPGGTLIAADHRHVEEALADTRQALGQASRHPPALFEAAFLHEGVFVRVDILEPLPTGGWRLVEVKSTASVKPVHVQDVAIQLWVLRGLGMDVRDAGVLVLNRDYVFDGVQLDVNALFAFHSTLERAEALQGETAANVRAMQAMLANSEAPNIAPGDHRTKPYPCPYYDHCARDLARPAHGVEELPHLGPRQRAKLAALDVVEVADIPDDFPLSSLQRVLREAVLAERPQAHGDLAAALDAIEAPVRHLDFETFAPAVPRYAGTRPYQTIPFLFSVHTERPGGAPEHADYLHEGGDDPRPALTRRLLAALGERGSICVYSVYERRILRALARALPQHQRALAAVQKRLVDVHRIVKRNYYHPAFRGSFSIKAVLPALCPDAGYDDLAIADGLTAAVHYQRALASDREPERRRAFADLRAYCQRDTLALVQLCEALRKASATAPLPSPQHNPP